MSFNLHQSCKACNNVCKSCGVSASSTMSSAYNKIQTFSLFSETTTFRYFHVKLLKSLIYMLNKQWGTEIHPLSQNMYVLLNQSVLYMFTLMHEETDE